MTNDKSRMTNVCHSDEQREDDPSLAHLPRDPSHSLRMTLT